MGEGGKEGGEGGMVAEHQQGHVRETLGRAQMLVRKAWRGEEAAQAAP